MLSKRISVECISSLKILFDNFRLELILVLSFKLSTYYTQVHSRTRTQYYFQIIINNLDIFVFVFQIACEKKSIPCSLEFEESDFIAPLESDESPDLDEFRYSLIQNNQNTLIFQEKLKYSQITNVFCMILFCL